MNSALFRTLLVYAIILPLAVMVGWMLSTPGDLRSMGVIGGVMFVLIIPLLLKWHYAALVFTWNSVLILGFFPGQPQLWTAMVAINLGMAVLYRILQKKPLFFHVPSVTFSLLAVLFVVLFTAYLRGGFGLRSLGSSTYGSKGYFYLIVAILGYFAFASQPVPLQRFGRYVGLYFLSGITGIVSNIIFKIEPLWFLYLLFPSGMALSQAYAEYTGSMLRFSGFAYAGSVLALFLLARYGVTGLLSVRKWWRPLLFTALVGFSLFGGYRSSLLALLLVVLLLFVFEGLVWTKVFPALLIAGLLGGLAVLPFVRELPYSIQRSLSFLPIDVDPSVKVDAASTIEWRLRMWETVVPDLHKYVIFGKGYSLNPTDMYLARESVRRGFAPNYTEALVVGDYHNGPLSIYIPFGGLGLVAFLCFVVAAMRALYANYRYGDEQLRTINRFFLCYFVAKFIFFVVAFGAISSDMAMFVGIIGLSVAFNRGVRSKAGPVVQPVRAPAPADDGFGLAPSSAG